MSSKKNLRSALKQIDRVARSIDIEKGLYFFLGLGIGGIGEIFSFWNAARLIIVFAISLCVYQFRQNHGSKCLGTLIILTVFIVWLGVSHAPLQAGILTLPGPDLLGLQRTNP